MFATYLAAIAGIFATTGVAFEVLHSVYPDVPEATLVRTLPGLLGGSLAASAGLLLTLLLVVHPLDAARLRLRPGWETGPTIAVMTLGLLALGQVLDSLTNLLGFGERGMMLLIRQALEGTGGSDLFTAVLVFGVAAGAAEEIFFRGYMQSRLREVWPPRVAILATSTAFAILHVDVSAVYAILALGLGLYLGFVTEATGSALPAIVCHVTNNIVYTLQTARAVSVSGRDAHVVAVVLGTLVVVGCVLWVRRAAARPTAV